MTSLAGKHVRVQGLHEPAVITGTGVCRRGLYGCRGFILWARTASGKPIPLDPDPDENGEYRDHRTTCPHAARFRRPEERPRKSGPAPEICTPHGR